MNCVCPALRRRLLCRASQRVVTEGRPPRQSGGLHRGSPRLQRREYRRSPPPPNRLQDGQTQLPLNAAVCRQEAKQHDFFVGTVRVNGRMDWSMLDSAVSQAFKVAFAVGAAQTVTHLSKCGLKRPPESVLQKSYFT